MVRPEAINDGCHVCLDQTNGDNSQLWPVSVRTARAVYRCVECNDAIGKAQQYQRISLKYDGVFSSYSTCLACVEVHRALSSCDREDGVAGYRMIYVLWDDIRECIFPDMTRACLEKCQTAAARQKLVQKWNDWKFAEGFDN